MKVLFLTTGTPEWASSRYRCYWPAQYIEGAHVHRWAQGEDIPDDYDVYIWQKVTNLAIVDQIYNDGKLQFWDLCDPVHWWQPTEARFVADRCHGVVCSSQALTDDFSHWYGQQAVCIRDRFEFSHYVGGRTEYRHADPVRLIWYGIANNRFSLIAALANMERLDANGVNITLTICDDQPHNEWTMTNAFQTYYTRWTLETEVKTIAAHDIAILPPYPGPWGKVKSNNKRIQAILCGIPWSDGQDYHDLYELATNAGLREDRVNDGRQRAMSGDAYNTRKSALEWEALINEFAKV